MTDARVLDDVELATLSHRQHRSFARDEALARQFGALEFIARNLGPVPDTPEAEADAPLETAVMETGFSPSNPPPAIDIAAEKRAAFEAGRAKAAQEHEAALEEMRKNAEEIAKWEADQQINETCAPLIRLIEKLTSSADALESALAARLDEAVRALASARAGLAIDDVPAAFRARIEELARATALESVPRRISLNPDDLGALSFEADALGGRLVADETLARGDVILDFGDMEVGDVLADARLAAP
ncbi:MAG: hypothetical protein MK180_07000 [Rhodobacteraceae bacterium]|nr:hypothetical protein [Paracoccaceae bacterium]